MNNLWAPWRITFIKKKKEKACFFCKIFKDRKDKNNYIIFRTSYNFVVLNRYPYNNGHIMIIPNRHISDITKLTENEILDINNTLVKMVIILKKVLKPQGFNIGANIGKIAGAGIDKHFHLHLVPRWLGDTNFMPVLTNTKVISQSLEKLYTEIKKCLSKKI